MRRPLVRVTVLLAALLALAAPSFARSVRTLNGTVATVSPAAASLKVSTASGVVTLNVVRSTRVTRNGKAVTLPSLAPRDSVRARFDSRTKVALSLAASGPALITVRGRVATVDTAGQNLTVTAPGGSRSFAVSGQTIVSRNGSISTLAKITHQDTVTVHVPATAPRSSSSASTAAADVEADGPEEADVEGAISAINGTDVTIHPRQGSDVTVHTGSGTMITLDDASATLADLAVGQRAESEYDPLSLMAFALHAESAETQHQEVAGTVAAVDTTAMTITINPANGGTAITLNVTSSTRISRDDQTATLGQIVQGDHASAQYDSSMNALQIEASSQGGDPNSTGEVEGTASGVSASGLTVTPEHGAAVVLTIDSTTRIELGDGQTGTAADIHDGDQVSVRYDTTTMVASRIEVEGQENAPPPATAEIEGTASGVSASGLTVTPEHGAAVALTIDGTTQIDLGDGHTGTAADIHDGDRVQVRYDTSTMLALQIEVDSEGHD